MSKTNIVVFIGGPLDGIEQTVVTVPRRYTVPIAPESGPIIDYDYIPNGILIVNKTTRKHYYSWKGPKCLKIS